MEVAGTEEMRPSVPGAVDELENIRSFAFFAILFCVLFTLILSTSRHIRSVIVVASCNGIIDDSRFAKYVYYIFD